MCPACEDLPLCETCKLEHEAGTGHATETCKEAGLAIMRQQYIQCADGRMAEKLSNRPAEMLRKVVKALEAGFLRGIDAFKESCAQNDERCSDMKKLDREGKYAELYSYGKNLPVGDATGELNKQAMHIIYTASAEVKKVLNMIAAATSQYKPAFSAYKQGEVLALEGKPYGDEEKVISALKTADMSTKVKAVYIRPKAAIGDRVASELVSCINQAHHTIISAIFLGGINISDTSAKLLAQAAFRSESISAFCIASEKVSDTGAKAVAEAARGCRSLTTLYLKGGEISDSGAVAVANVAKDCPISAFYLWGSKISDMGAISVANTMKCCPMSAFCLCSSEMSDAGARTVAETVKCFPISAFLLGGDKISDAGASDVAEIISGGCAGTLSAFCMWSNSISDVGAKRVVDAVKGCEVLSAFCLCGKPISGERLAYIVDDMANVSTIRSITLHIGAVSKVQMEHCLSLVEHSIIARQLKLRFQCDTVAVKNMCDELKAGWEAKFAEFSTVSGIVGLFERDAILGLQK